MKLFNTFILSFILLAFSACGSRIPFKAQEPLENSALVYVYVISANSSVENTANTKYAVRINNKRVDDRITNEEYMAFNLKPKKMTISATRNNIEEIVLELKLEAGKIYYLRVEDDIDDGRFSFEHVEDAIGSQEILRTGLTGSILVNKDEIITEFADSTEMSGTTQTISKTDEIEKAYALKEKGIISNEEFKALKADILAK